MVPVWLYQQYRDSRVVGVYSGVMGLLMSLCAAVAWGLILAALFGRRDGGLKDVAAPV
jgi:hypothetical protein